MLLLVKSATGSAVIPATTSLLFIKLLPFTRQTAGTDLQPGSITKDSDTSVYCNSARTLYLIILSYYFEISYCFLLLLLFTYQV